MEGTRPTYTTTVTDYTTSVEDPNSLGTTLVSNPCEDLDFASGNNSNSSSPERARKKNHTEDVEIPLQNTPRVTPRGVHVTTTTTVDWPDSFVDSPPPGLLQRLGNSACDVLLHPHTPYFVGVVALGIATTFAFLPTELKYEQQYFNNDTVGNITEEFCVDKKGVGDHSYTAAGGLAVFGLLIKGVSFLRDKYANNGSVVVVHRGDVEDYNSIKNS